MSILEIKKIPDKVLRRKAAVVGNITGAEIKLVKDMFDTMYFSSGVGLAAPQVGISRRIIVCNPTGQRADELAIIDPKIIWRKGKKVKECEGCLSIPTITNEVTRYWRLRVEGKDVEGSKIAIEAEGLLARIIDHECDHLDGVLFIDKIGLLKRKLLMNKYKKKMGLTCVGKWY